LQTVLTANDGILADAGIYVPHAGRLDATGGHHNIAWELNEDHRFDATRGTFADALEEIARRGAPRVCLSSEDFEYLHVRPQALRAIADGLREIGYLPVVVVYLRPQAGYAESLYAELVKHGLAQTFDAFLSTIIAEGEFRFNGRWCFTLDYERLLDDFAEIFGVRQVITRRYVAGVGDVVGDFMQLIGAGAPQLQDHVFGSRRLNASLSFSEVLRLLDRNTRPSSASQTLPVRRIDGLAGRFDPVHLREVRRIVGRFNGGNRRVHEKYGALIPCVSGRDLMGDLGSVLGINPASRYRKRVLDARAQTLRATTAIVVPQRREEKRAVQPRGTDRRRSFRPAIGRINERVFAPKFARPACLEAVIVGTAAVVAIASLSYGERNGSTALVEFGMLSTIVAGLATALVARYAVESRDLIADYPFFNDWGARLSVAGYGIVGLYALVNAMLDVGVPRYEPDQISYPGTIVTAVAALILSIVLPARRRLLAEISHVPTFEHLRHDGLYLACSYITVLGQIAHAVDSAWWLDTSIDVLFVAFVGLKVQQIRRSSSRTVG